MMAWNFDFLQGSVICLLQNENVRHSVCCYDLLDLFSVVPNSSLPRFVNSQLVCLLPVGILKMLCLICFIFRCNAHLNILVVIYLLLRDQFFK